MKKSTSLNLITKSNHHLHSNNNRCSRRHHQWSWTTSAVFATKLFHLIKHLVVTKPATVNLHQKHQHFPLHYQRQNRRRWWWFWRGENGEIFSGKEKVQGCVWWFWLKCEEGGICNAGAKWEKQEKNKLKSEKWTFSKSIKLVPEHVASFLPRVQDNTACRATCQHG